MGNKILQGSLKLTDWDSYTMDLHGDGFSVSDAAGYKFAELDLSENRFELGINVTNSGGVTTNRNLHLSTSGLTFTNNESDTSADIGVQTNGNTSLTLIDRDGYKGLLTGWSFYFGDYTSRFLEFDISETRLEFGISDGTQTAFHPGSISIYNKNDATLNIGRFGKAPDIDRLGLQIEDIDIYEYVTDDGCLGLNIYNGNSEDTFALRLGSVSGSCDLVMPTTQDWETIRLNLPSKSGTLALTNQFNFTTTSNTAILKVGPDNTHTMWNFGKGAGLHLDVKTSSSSGYTSYGIDMTKVLLGTFDSSSGTLILSTPTVSHVDEIF